MSVENKRKAVAYLLRSKDEQPEETKKLFEKLEMHEGGIAQIDKAIEDAKNHIAELTKRFEQAAGATQAVADIIIDMLPDEESEEWAKKLDTMIAQGQPEEEK